MNGGLFCLTEMILATDWKKKKQFRIDGLVWGAINGCSVILANIVFSMVATPLLKKEIPLAFWITSAPCHNFQISPAPFVMNANTIIAHYLQKNYSFIWFMLEKISCYIAITNIEQFYTQRYLTQQTIPIQSQ